MHYSASAFLSGDEDTTRLGTCLAAMLRAGDTLLLEGPIGAGKTSLARAIIQARLSASGQAEDVPSPTYTIIQTYDDGKTEIWHADLYRLTDISELFELGLDEAYQNAIVLVEWPDRLGDLAPSASLHVTLGLEKSGRRITFSADSDRWRPLIEVVSDA